MSRYFGAVFNLCEQIWDKDENIKNVPCIRRCLLKRLSIWWVRLVMGWLKTLIQVIETPRKRQKQDKTEAILQRLVTNVLRRPQLVKNQTNLRHKAHERRTRHLWGVTKGSGRRAQLFVSVLHFVRFRSKCGQILTSSVSLTFNRHQVIS